MYKLNYNKMKVKLLNSKKKVKSHIKIDKISLKSRSKTLERGVSVHQYTYHCWKKNRMFGADL